jgi:UDP-2-acetamido-2,6-beta-L-arabino-hexul-4-ose reductase
VDQPVQRILVTGAQGFIGKNLLLRLKELNRYTVTEFVRSDKQSSLQQRVAHADAIIHLAGENRPKDESAFAAINTGLTAIICDAIRASGRKIPLILASSTQAEQDNPYGKSKLAAEQLVQNLSSNTGSPITIFRLPGVFGKWCKPFYNSVVATFCHNIARGLPIRVNDPHANLRLVYIDDVISALIDAIDTSHAGFQFRNVAPEYNIKLGELATQIESFEACRNTLLTEPVGTGLTRALYSTYISYLPQDRFAYAVPQHADERGVFVEMLKTHDSGQFSFFTAKPGITRGGHYHHTKTEKFLVLKSEALFRFRNLLTGEVVEIKTSGDKPQIVDTIPGWVHDITNIGDEEMIVMLWANENFDRAKPDTISQKV